MPVPSTTVSVTIVRADKPKHGARVGQRFDLVSGHAVVIPEGNSFPVYLMTAVIPVLLEKQLAVDDPTSWISRKPYLLGPDAEEQIVMRLDYPDKEEQR